MTQSSRKKVSILRRNGVALALLGLVALIASAHFLRERATERRLDEYISAENEITSEEREAWIKLDDDLLQRQLTKAVAYEAEDRLSSIHDGDILGGGMGLSYQPIVVTAPMGTHKMKLWVSPWDEDDELRIFVNGEAFRAVGETRSGIRCLSIGCTPGQQLTIRDRGKHRRVAPCVNELVFVKDVPLDKR